MSGVEYLFVTGCARSGTSAMAALLRAAPEIAMGDERFAARYFEERDLSPSLFEKERFCRQLLPGDSYQWGRQPYYEELYERFDHCRYRGDKIPEMASDYGPLLASYERPKIIYMLRNIFDVADSFNRRALRDKSLGFVQGWPPDRGSAAAVAEWNASVNNTLGVLGEIDFLFIIYERFFSAPSELDRVFQFLHVPVGDATVEAYGRLARKHLELEEQRQIRMTSNEKMHILRNVDCQAYRRLLQLAEDQSQDGDVRKS